MVDWLGGWPPDRYQAGRCSRRGSVALSNAGELHHGFWFFVAEAEVVETTPLHPQRVEGRLVRLDGRLVVAVQAGDDERGALTQSKVEHFETRFDFA